MSHIPTPRWINGIEPTEALLRLNGTEILEYECRQQPALLKALIAAYSTDPTILAQLSHLRELAANKGPILFIGMGGSFCSALSASTHLQSHGRPAFTVDAGEWLHYAAPVWNDAALSILLTTSGESAELVELLRKGQGSPIALISNNSASTAWNMTQNRLPILAGPEYGNATKTYTNSTAASIMLASAILNQPWHSEATQVAATYTSDLARIFAQRTALEAFTRAAANIEIIGRGAAYGAAIMGALTIREMSGFRAAPHTGAGFKHGPNLDVDATHVAIIFALGRAAGLGVKLAEECNRRGGKVVLVSNEDTPQTPSLYPIKLSEVPRTMGRHYCPPRTASPHPRHD